MRTYRYGDWPAGCLLAWREPDGSMGLTLPKYLVTGIRDDGEMGWDGVYQLQDCVQPDEDAMFQHKDYERIVSYLSVSDMKQAAKKAARDGEEPFAFWEMIVRSGIEVWQDARAYFMHAVACDWKEVQP